MKIKFLTKIILASVCLLTSGTTIADASTAKLVKLLVQEGILSKEKADLLLKQVAEDSLPKADEGQANAAPADPLAVSDGKVIRMQYVPEFVKQEMREEIKKDVIGACENRAMGRPEAASFVAGSLYMEWRCAIASRQYRLFGSKRPAGGFPVGGSRY